MVILVIDDDLNFLRLFQEKFEDRGHEVLLAGDGKEALEIYEKEIKRIDAVTIDILLPDTDGITLLKQLKGKNIKLPMIMLSAYDYRDDFAAWLSEAYFVKGYSTFDEIVAMIEKLAAKYRENFPKNKL